ncbi:hypothetical protein [Streptomyces sp. NPDC054940]
MVGTAVLTSTTVVVGGEETNSATGVHTCIAIAATSFVTATLAATILARLRQPFTGLDNKEQPGL